MVLFQRNTAVCTDCNICRRVISGRVPKPTHIASIIGRGLHAKKQKLPNKVGVDYRTTFNHLNELGKVHKAGQWVPNQLSGRSRNRCMSWFFLLRKSFVDRILTRDPLQELEIKEMMSFAQRALNVRTESQLILARRRDCTSDGTRREWFAKSWDEVWRSWLTMADDNTSTRIIRWFKKSQIGSRDKPKSLRSKPT